MVSFNTARDIAASPAAVFAAFSQPERLARWWGPAGFTNTFTACDFRTGGRWTFVMHGPDGSNYPNESVFEEVQPERLVVVRHVNAPHFSLRITLAPSATGTALRWEQQFEDDEVARRLAPIVEPANEQNLDRLTQEVLRP